MRQLLVAVLMVAVVVSLYITTVQGDEGMHSQIQDSGMTIAEAISRISP